MSETIHGFRDRQIAAALRDYGQQLINARGQGKVVTPAPAPFSKHREFWIRPKDTIPKAIDAKTPGLGTGFICALNRDASPPTIERLQINGADVEIEVFNWTTENIVADPVDDLLPLVRAAEDTFGELSIFSLGGGASIRKAVSAASTLARNPATIILVDDDTDEEDIDELFDFTQPTEQASYDWLTGNIPLTKGDLLFVTKMADGSWQVIGAECKQEDPGDPL